MPRDSGGAYTLPPANPVVDGTVIETLWANSTMTDIAVQLNNLITRDGLLGATAPIGFTDGSAPLPGITFAAQPNTGFYRAGANTIGVSTGGVGAVIFAPGGTSFGDPVSLSAGTAALPGLAFSGDPNTGIYSPGADIFAVTANGTEQLRVNANGNLLVNTSITHFAFGSRGVIEINGGSALLGLSVGNTPTSYLQASSGETQLATLTNTPLTFLTNSVERARMDVNGNLLVGITTPIFGAAGRSTFAINNASSSLLELDVAGAGGGTLVADATQVQLFAQGSTRFISFGTGGAERMRIDAGGEVMIGVTTPRSLSGYRSLNIGASLGGTVNFMANGVYQGLVFGDLSSTGLDTIAGRNIDFNIAGVNKVRIDPNGNFLVGVTSGPCHTIARGNGSNDQVLNVSGLANGSCQFFSGTAAGFNAAAACLKVSNNSGRSINAGGTFNGNGTDYAEYEYCGDLVIEKGAIVGFKADGTLTLTFSEAVRFGIKSTNPSYVGGDTWGIDVFDNSETFEAVRKTVDRIAYSGKVPVNVKDALPGEYIIAVSTESGAITGIPVSAPTFEQYRFAVGRVNKILEDGRAEVAVIIH